MTDVRNPLAAIHDAELARQLALASTMTLAISQVGAAHEALSAAVAAADDRRASAVMAAYDVFAYAVRSALSSYREARDGLEAGAPDDDDEE